MKAHQFNRQVRWIISYLTLLIIFLFSTAYYLYEPQIEEIDQPSTISVFAYPLTDPEFLQAGNIIVSYEFVSEGRHLVAVDNNGKQYILPLFNDRETAIDFMNQYFVYLRELESDQKNN